MISEKVAPLENKENGLTSKIGQKYTENTQNPIFWVYLYFCPILRAAMFSYPVLFPKAWSRKHDFPVHENSGLKKHQILGAPKADKRNTENATSPSSKGRWWKNGSGVLLRKRTCWKLRQSCWVLQNSGWGRFGAGIVGWRNSLSCLPETRRGPTN